MYKKLAAIGDSFSSTDYGLSWPDLVADKLHCDLVRASSPGAGNSFYVDADKATNFSVVGMKTPFTDDDGNTNPGFYLDQVFYSSAGTATINLDKTTNVSTCAVWGNMSKGCTLLIFQPFMLRSCRSRARVAGSQEI